MSSRYFPLRYPKHCASCSEWMEEDTLVVFHEDEIVHDNCAGEVVRSANA